MEPEGSLPYSQESVICLYSELLQSSPCSPFHFLKIRFNIILISMPGFFELALPLSFSNQSPVCTSTLPISAAPI